MFLLLKSSTCWDCKYMPMCLIQELFDLYAFKTLPPPSPVNVPFLKGSWVRSLLPIVVILKGNGGFKRRGLVQGNLAMEVGRGMDRTVFRKDKCSSHESLKYFLLITELYDHTVFIMTSGCHWVCELTAVVGTYLPKTCTWFAHQYPSTGSTPFLGAIGSAWLLQEGQSFSAVV